MRNSRHMVSLTSHAHTLSLLYTEPPSTERSPGQPVPLPNHSPHLDRQPCPPAVDSHTYPLWEEDLTPTPFHIHSTPTPNTDHPRPHVPVDTGAPFKDINTVTYLQSLFFSCGNKTTNLEVSEKWLLLFIKKSIGNNARTIQELGDHFNSILNKSVE